MPIFPEILGRIKKNYKYALLAALSLMALQPRTLSKAEVPPKPHQWYLTQPYGINNISPIENFFYNETGDIAIVDTGYVYDIPDSFEKPTISPTHAATTDAIISGIETDGISYEGIYEQEETSFFLYGNTVESMLENLEKAVNTESVRTILLEFHFPGKSEEEVPYNKEFRSLIEKALDNGKLVLGACGNEKQNACNFPSSIDGVITVSATNEIGLLTSVADENSGSNWQLEGEGRTDICAPGSMVRRVDGEKRILDYVWGTSIALAVAGASFEKIWDLNPDLTREELIEHVVSTAKKQNVDPRCGNGIIDIAAASSTESVNGTIAYQIRGQSQVHTQNIETKEIAIKNATGIKGNSDGYEFTVNIPPVEQTYITFEGTAIIDGVEYTCAFTSEIAYKVRNSENSQIAECDPKDAIWGGAVENQTAMINP
jgi:hypothetical protein